MLCEFHVGRVAFCLPYVAASRTAAVEAGRGRLSLVIRLLSSEDYGQRPRDALCVFNLANYRYTISATLNVLDELSAEVRLSSTGRLGVVICAEVCLCVPGEQANRAALAGSGSFPCCSLAVAHPPPPVCAPFTRSGKYKNPPAVGQRELVVGGTRCGFSKRCHQPGCNEQS